MMAQKNLKFTTASSSSSSKQASSVPKSTAKQSSSKSPNTQEHSVTKKSVSSQQPQFRFIENFIIIWLDSNLDEFDEENQGSMMTQLRHIVHTIKIFTDVDQCIQFIVQIADEKIFLIVSDSLGQQIVSRVQQFSQIDSIYVFCHHKTKNDQWIKESKKVKGIFTQIQLLCTVLKQDVHQLNNDLISTSIVPVSSTTDLNQLDPSFMYCQLLKENLFTIEYDDRAMNDLAAFCRYHYQKDDRELSIIDEFEQEYSDHSPIWWYTRECFLYNMLNRALRILDSGIIIKMGFFVRDLHHQIKERHSKLRDQHPFTVYRGQVLSTVQFEQMTKSNGGLISFNNFLSTSEDKDVALRFVRGARIENNMMRILFHMEIDPSISSTPFTSVREISDIAQEEEILFSMSTVFRIGDMKMLEDRFWQVNLTLTSDQDQQLKRLTDHMRTALGDGSGWHRLGQLMIKMGKFDKAAEIYQTLLTAVSSNDTIECAFLHNQLGYVWKQKGDLTKALDHYKDSLTISSTYLPFDDPRLSSTYSNVGAILKKQGDLEGALKYFERTLQSSLRAAKPNPLEIAIDHNNIGSVLETQGKYNDALKIYKQSLEIKLAHLPPHHPSLATTYSNIGLVHRKMGDSSTALSFYQKTLEIQQKSLPPNHPSLITTHGNMAAALENLHQYKEAVEHAEQAFNIARHSYEPKDAEVQKRQNYVVELRQKL